MPVSAIVKLKHLPEDFEVDEQTGVSPGGGVYALYRLTKQGLGTPEAVDAIARRWKIPRHRIGFGGLKDRHALTRQMVTIRNGPPRGLKQTHLELDYLGQVERSFTSADIAANAFRVTLRDVAEADVPHLDDALAAAARDGLPNYFDDQRFGSLGPSREFIARPWCAGDYERALRLALTEPNPHDRPRQKADKRLLAEQWGHWAACARVQASPARAVVNYLAGHAADYRGAIARIPPELRRMYLSALQSFLWNRLLAAWLHEQCQPYQLLQTTIAQDTLVYHRHLDDAQRKALAGAMLPLPSARLHPEEGPLKALIERVLAQQGLTLKDLQVDYPRDSFFSKGERKAVYVPQEMSHAWEADEEYPGRQKCTLRFTLLRGMYATILTRRLMMAEGG